MKQRLSKLAVVDWQCGWLGLLPLGLMVACGDAPATAPLAIEQQTFLTGGAVSNATAIATGGQLGTGGVATALTGGDMTPAVAVTTTDGAVAAPDFCAVRDVVERNCKTCHGETLMGGAPMQLLTYDNFQAAAVSDPSKKVFELVSSRIHDTSRPMPPVPNVLSDADRATLDNWVAGGAQPPADPSCPGLVIVPDATDVAMDWPAGCDDSNTYTILSSAANDPSQPYMVPANSETHPQFYFDAPWGNTPVQMVAYRPIVGSGNVAHHWILYSSGGTGLAAATGQFLVSWSPGKDEDPGLPDNVGIYLPSGPQSLRLDMHYFNLNNPAAVPDQTGLEVCVTTEFKEFSATVYSLTASATVPANSKVDNSQTCTVSVSAGADAHLVSVSPHMHSLGVNGKLELTRNGVKTVLHDQPFNAEDQTIWTLNNLPIQNGDQLTTTCSYENNTNKTVTFGQSSTDEMCFNFVLYYPMGAFSCL